MNDDDVRYMHIALQAAERAAQQGEVPVGAVLVHQHNIITIAANAKETQRDATRHAEMLALSAASQRLDNWRLLDTTLYVTLEPCLMCSGAIYQARLARLVFAATDRRYGAFRWVHARQHELFNHRVTLQHGICAEASAALLRDFFQQRRS